MAVGEQADEEAVDELPLADQHALDRPVERIELRPQFLDGRRGRSWIPRGANNLMIQTRRERGPAVPVELDGANRFGNPCAVGKNCWPAPGSSRVNLNDISSRSASRRCPVTRSARVLAGIGLLVLLVALLCRSAPSAQPPKKVLTFADYDIWRTGTHAGRSRRTARTRSSPSRRPRATAKSIVRHIASGKEHRFPRGGGDRARRQPEVHAGRQARPPAAHADEGRARQGQGGQGEDRGHAAVVARGRRSRDRERSPTSSRSPGSFAVGGEGAGFVVYRKPSRNEAGKDGKDEEKAETPPTGRWAASGGKGGGKFGGKGAERVPTAAGQRRRRNLRLRTPHPRPRREDRPRRFPDVAQFALSKDGQLLVYTVASRKEETNGVYAVNPRSGGSAAAIKCGAGPLLGADLGREADEARVPLRRQRGQAGERRAAAAAQGSRGRHAGRLAPTPPPQPKWRVFVWDRNAKARRRRRSRACRSARPAASRRSSRSAWSPNPPSVRAGRRSARPGHARPTRRLDVQRRLAQLLAGRHEALRHHRAEARTGRERAARSAATDDFQLDLWHWKDERLQPMQKLQAAADQAQAPTRPSCCSTRSSSANSPTRR